MQPKFDLHVHTTASDGEFNAQEIIQKAKSVGLTTIAITDHDTIGNVANCIYEGEKLGIKVITGVELSAEVTTGKMHILGYGFALNNNNFNNTMEKLREGRIARNNKIIEELNKLGINITADNLKKHAVGDSVGKPHIAKAIAENNIGINIEEAFKILGKNEIDKIERYKLPPKECIELITQAGGIAFLAHPNTLHADDNLQPIIAELIQYGLKGIEVYHSSHKPEQSALYKQIAERNNLLISCGSDFHGPKIKKDVKLGSGCNNNLPTHNESILNEILKTLQK